mmetsp:Transcript_15809/g.25254  ORF Transcript_15809/g.25254 Transcript_15809/m.25254 type:complete len:82 (-) Transcript_15809:140-385(-)
MCNGLLQLVVRPRFVNTRLHSTSQHGTLGLFLQCFFFCDTALAATLACMIIVYRVSSRRLICTSSPEFMYICLMAVVLQVA